MSWQEECISCQDDDLVGVLLRDRFLLLGKELLGCMRISKLEVSLRDGDSADAKLRTLSDMALRIISGIPGRSDVGGERQNALRLFLAKNHDYGDAFVSYGVVGIMVRLGDKFSRLESLWSPKHDPAVVSESESDTLVDIYNYCIMVLMVMHKTS